MRHISAICKLLIMTHISTISITRLMRRPGSHELGKGHLLTRLSPITQIIICTSAVVEYVQIYFYAMLNKGVDRVTQVIKKMYFINLKVVFI